jgi:hypothetical protein
MLAVSERTLRDAFETLRTSVSEVADSANRI